MELEETLYWLELLEASGAMSPKQLAAFKDESGQLTAIFVSIIKKSKH
jgi:four helix bundle protein